MNIKSKLFVWNSVGTLVLASFFGILSSADAQRISTPVAGQSTPVPPVGTRPTTTRPTTTRPTQPTTTPTQPPAMMTKVLCLGNVTVAERGGQQSAPIFQWQTNYFGDKYTPQQRCQIVSAKLQNAINLSGGRFDGVRFVSGTVNGQLVVCALTPNQTVCDSNTMLFTLKPENRRIVGNILETLTGFSRNPRASQTIIEDRGEGIEVDISDLELELNQGNSDYYNQPQQEIYSAPSDGGNEVW